MDENAIKQLADKEKIISLRYRFGHAVDKRNWLELEAIFTDTIDTDFSQFGIPAAQMPRDAFIAIFKHSFRNAQIRTQQVYSGFLIDVNDDKATCRSYLHGHHYLQGFPGGDSFELRAEYIDELVRTPKGWRIAKVTLNVVSTIGNMGLVA